MEVAAQGGDAPALVAKLKAAQAERDALARKLATAPPRLPTDEEIAVWIDDAVSGFRALLDADRGDQRVAMHALLRDRRLRVGQDAERGFRVDGLLRLNLGPNAVPGAHEDPGYNEVVAGGCYVPGEPGGEVPFDLILAA